MGMMTSSLFLVQRNRLSIWNIFLWIGCIINLSSSLGQKDELLCSIGFGNPTKQVIPVEQINDGYCDCPSDGGIDELETGACSGSDIGGWSGNKLYSDAPLVSFQCPEENQLWLAPSKVNDGICDCCDGADELPGVCADICDEVLAEERAKRERLQTTYEVGSSLRQTDVAHFLEIKESTLAKLKKIQNEQMPPMQQELDKYKIKFDETQLHFISRKLETMKQIYTFMSNDSIINPFHKNDSVSIEEIQIFIASVCHYYGEMTHHKNYQPLKQNTCVPLRMAALELGIWWEAEDLEQKTAKVEYLDTQNYNNELASNLADHYYQHYYSSTKDDKNDQSEMVFPYAPILPTQNRNHQQYREVEENDRNDNNYIEEILEENEKVISQNLENNDFSSPIMIWRTNFYTYAKATLVKLDQYFDSGNEQDDNEEVEEEQKIETNDDSNSYEQVDPMAMQMLRTNLEHRVGSIERGNAIAGTSKILLESLKDVENIEIDSWIHLATGVIRHSNLGVADIAEILTLSEIEIVAESCFSPYVSLCSKDLSKSTKSPFLSSSEILHYISIRCQHRNNNENQCATDDVSDENTDSIVLTIPDGYLDYYTVVPRTDIDPYTQISHETKPMLEEDEIILQNLFEINEFYDEIDSKMNDLKQEVKDLELSIGVGKEENYFGFDGTLYALKDKCFELPAGKYVYKLCLFGRAAQLDGSSSTDLGEWDGIRTTDDVETEQIWEWSGGQKCWNGPQRSATAFVRCGIETKILSAEEPNICQYEFEIESHIACDDTFKHKHRL